MSDILVRKAQPSDAEVIAAININSWKTTYKDIIDSQFLDSLQIAPRIPGAIRRIERLDLDCFVAVDLRLNQVVGFADFGPCRDKNIDADAELYAIYLRDLSKKKGIGKALFARGFQATKNRHCKKMMVSVFERNVSAKAFYEKMGGQLHSITDLDLGGRRYPTANYVWIF
jgi:GNAT superfamily N-acetyltransferase